MLEKKLNGENREREKVKINKRIKKKGEKREREKTEKKGKKIIMIR